MLVLVALAILGIWFHSMYFPAGENADAEYRQMITRVQEAAKKVPEGATVLVISQWDDGLVRLPGRTGWHFPQNKEGAYADNPADSAEAIACLERLREKGGQYLLIPEPYWWWLDHYKGFRDHLNKDYRRVYVDKDCVIYDLTRRRGG
jgi:hypothetical protein